MHGSTPRLFPSLLMGPSPVRVWVVSLFFLTWRVHLSSFSALIFTSELCAIFLVLSRIWFHDLFVVPSVPPGNKLAQLKPSLRPWSFCSQRCRRLEISLSHLLISHTRLTHGHLITREASPVCSRCQARLRFSIFWLNSLLILCHVIFFPFRERLSFPLS